MTAKAMRPPKRRCETCRYWQELEDCGEGRTGDCNRYPPVLLFSSDVRGYEEWGNPETGVYATCGEWAEDDGRHKWREPK